MDAAVEAILEARRARRVLAPLGTSAPADEAAGYALQRKVAEGLGAVPPAGFKIGATTRQMQEYLGLAGPAAGFVPQGSLNPGGAGFRFADFLNPGVECEIGVRLGRDLPAGPCTREAAAEAVAEVFPAVEIVERRYGDLGELGTPTLIADQVFHASGVLGAPAEGWRGLDLAAVQGVFHVGGRVVGSGHGRDLLGHPFAALAWLAGSGAAREFGGLRAGQVIWLGSVTPPIWLDGPGEVVADFGPLGAARLRFV
ncbi:2-keto-4-pentenoate hydratase [Belnapia rosea]|uniref:2-keto-4-pentenoate hydratase n=1 Tax=Belnapia rosea TaxID=938405 RepID=UPI00088BF2C3|nr:fumarylacetoacetate hydrolase family protein [Belnapia rosea]SDB61797.1 2-oxo-3-hexenedioate decarboxylase [Belnapia rosea]